MTLRVAKCGCSTINDGALRPCLKARILNRIGKYAARAICVDALVRHFAQVADEIGRKDNEVAG